jgi:hypothetical protein
MSEETTPQTNSDDARVNITAKDAAARLTPAGVDMSKMSPEQQMELTSNMVQASTLHEKYVSTMTPEEVEVFDALLLATAQDAPVKERFASALDKFNKVRNKQEEKQEETEEKEVATKVSPKGEMDVAGQPSPTPDGNLLSPENDAPLGDDNEYFKFLEKRYRQQTTIRRKQQ